MRQQLVLVLVSATFVGASPVISSQRDYSVPEARSVVADAVSPVWIEYSVTGDAELQAREEDVVMCGVTDDGLKIHTLGAWNITLEANGNGAGEHAVRFMVAVPDSITALHDDNFRTDDRFYGDGTMTVTSAGKDDYGFDLITAEFSGVDLQSATEHTISLKGKLGCQVL